MLTAAIRDPDPVIFLEPKARYWQRPGLQAALPPLPLDPRASPAKGATPH